MDPRWAAVEWEEIPSYGDHMEMAGWLESVRKGGFIDYDGFGYLATADKMSNLKIYPSDVGETEVDPPFTHIVWFNR
jgi:hypothetical protein